MERLREVRFIGSLVLGTDIFSVFYFLVCVLIWLTNYLWRVSVTFTNKWRFWLIHKMFAIKAIPHLITPYGRIKYIPILRTLQVGVFSPFFIFIISVRNPDK